MKCQIWIQIRELERLAMFSPKGTPLNYCLKKCNGERIKCKDYVTGFQEVYNDFGQKKLQEDTRG